MSVSCVVVLGWLAGGVCCARVAEAEYGAVHCIVWLPYHGMSMWGECLGVERCERYGLCWVCFSGWVQRGEGMC